MTNDDLLTSAEVARLLRVHPKHLYRLLRRGLPGHRHGRGHWRFRRDEVLAWMDARDAARSSTDGIEAELVTTGARTPEPETHAPSSPLRVLLGRVGRRWVAHPLGVDARRSADALVDRARASGRVRASTLAPLGRLEHNVLVAGCAPVLGLVLDRAQQGLDGRAHWITSNSRAALSQLVDGTVHVAGIHLEDREAGKEHETLVREALGASVRLVRLVRWQMGLALGPTVADRTVASLLEPAVRWVLREPGAGARSVLERAMSQRGATVEALSVTAMARAHDEVARTIAAGLADAGPCIEPVARARGLDFLPLQEEGFDLAVRADGLAQPHVARLLSALDDARLRREVSALGFYDASALGHAA